MSRNPKCSDCVLHKSTVHRCVWGQGEENADVMIVGEAPGEAEAQTGKPFQGKSGQLLRAELAAAGIESTYITNVCKCRPPQNRTPKPEEMAACRKYLDEEIATVKPKFIVAAGATALKAMTRRAGITAAHGQLIPMKDGTIVIPIFHPAYILRDPSKMGAFKQDMARIARALQGTQVIDDLNWSLVTPDSIEEFFEEFETSNLFSFDLETSGLFPFDGKGFVRCIGIGLENRTWVIPAQMPDSPWRGRSPAVRVILETLKYLQDRDSKRAVGHNAKFDNQWLHVYYGVTFHLNFDTMLAHHLLDENSEHGLKTLARQYLDVADYDISTSQKKGSIDSNRLYEYNAKDCHYTRKLALIFDKELKKSRSLRALFYKLVMPGARALTEMEREGMTIDLAKRDEVEFNTRIELNRTEQKLNKQLGRKINWNSPPQVGKALYGDLGLTCTLKTESGKPSTAEAAILDLKGKHPVVDLLIRYRELAKFLSTYIEGFKEWMHEDKLYVSYKIHGTVTGRFSSRIHSIPRDGTIRNLVVAPPGWTFFQADVSQAELRIAGVISGDVELITCYRRGIDVHWRTLMFMISTGQSAGYVAPAIETAQTLTGKKLSLVDAIEVLETAGPDKCTGIWKGWKEARKRAKAVNFGFIYGMYPKKFIETAKMKYGFEPTLREAEAAREGYFRLYRDLPTWHEKQKKLVRLNGEVRNLIGRVRRLPTIHSNDRGLQMECERQAINSPVQGFIGDYKAMAMVEIHGTVDRSKCRLVGEHHDALLGIVKNGCEDEVLPEVLRIMRHPSLLDEFKVELPVPMEADIELGPWGAGKKYIEKKLDRNQP